jgi:apolipoprotein N-acyltransferase
VGYPAGLVGLVVVLALARHTPGWARRAGWGLLFGVGFFGVALGWSARFGLVASASLVASQAVFPALALALAPPRRGAPGRWVAGAAAAWVLAELARARVPLGGFEWAQLGQLTVDLPLRAGAAVVGSAGLSGAVVAGAAALVAVADPASRRARLGALGGAAAVAAALAAVGSLAWTTSVGALTVTIVQADPACPHQPPVDCPRRADTLAQLTAATDDVPATVDLVLWGEGAASQLTPAEAGRRISRHAGELPAPLLAGVTTPVGADHFVNRNVVYDPHGRVRETYCKRHPVPFGEYVPGRGVLGGVGEAGRRVPRDMIPGDTPGRLGTLASPLGTVSSWEASFARRVRDAARATPAVVTLTSQASFAHDPVSDQLLAIARIRAAETRKPMLVAALTGRSAIIAADGRMPATTRRFAADQLTGTLPLHTGTTPFARTGETGPAVAAVALALAAAPPPRPAAYPATCARAAPAADPPPRRDAHPADNPTPTMYPLKQIY